MNDQKKTLKGPNGIRIELDKNEVVLDDPGAGTPAMVYKKTEGKRELWSTYWTACDTGELMDDDLGSHPLSQRQCDWLNDQNAEVNEFLYGTKPEPEEAE